jgi:hypothetical protein
MSDVNSFNSDPIFSEYSPHGRNYGNPLVNMLMRGTFGFNYAPKPQNGQGMYDAYFQRERSREFYDIQKGAFSNNMLFRAGGLNPNSSMMKFGASAFSNPDGLVSRMLSPLIGGNPMAAQMQLYAGLNGANVMGAFGRIDGVSKKETDQMMRVLEKSFYKMTPYEDVAKEYDENFREDLRKNPEYARQMGVGVKMTKDGKVDEAAAKELRSTGQEREKNVTNLVKTLDDFEIQDKFKKTGYDDVAATRLGKSITEDFKSLGFSEQQSKNLYDSTGEINTGGVSAMYQEAKKNLRTKDDYQQDLISAMADKMGLPATDKRSATLRGGVPTTIDGQAVPAELYTQEQRDNVDAARDVAAKMEGRPSPPRIDPNIPVAPADTYKDIKPIDPQDKITKQQEIFESIRDRLGAFKVNERNRKYSENDIGKIREGLNSEIAAAGKVGDADSLSTEAVQSMKQASQSAVKEISQTSADLDKNEIKRGTQEYDEQLSRALNERLKKKLKESLKVSEEELRKNTGSSGNLDKAFVQEQMNKETRGVAKIESLFAKYTNAQKNMGAASSGDKDFDSAKFRELDTELREQLKKNFGVTDEQLKKAERSDGTLDPAFVKETQKKATERANLEKAGVNPEEIEKATMSDKLEDIKSARIDRIVSVNELGDLQQQTEEIMSSGKKADRSKKLKQKYGEIKDTLKELGVSDEEIAENTRSEGGILGFGGDETIDEDFIEEKRREALKASKVERDAERLEGYKKGGGRYAGINFEKTRGFNMEDFTSGFTAAADLRLLGGKGTPEMKMEQFAENAGGAMSAARSVFGDKLSGGQLVGKISDMLGSKAANLGSQEGSAEVEKMLRDVKATARVAGISIDSLLGVIDSAKEVAKNNPRLRSMSSAATTEMSMKALNTVAAMSGVMSADEYRKSGGSQQMMADKIGEQQKLLSSEAGQSVAALKQAYKTDPSKKAALDRVLGEYKESGLTSKDYPQLVKKLLAQDEFKGSTVGEVYGLMNNSAIRSQAMKDDNIVKETSELTNKSAVKQLYSRLKNSPLAGKVSPEQLIEKFKEYQKENPEASLSDFMLSDRGIGKDQRASGYYEEFKSTINEDLMRRMDPEYFAKVEKRRDALSKQDAELDKKFAARNAPVITQLASALAEGGELDSDKTKKLLSVFADESLYSKKETAKLTAGFEDAIAGGQDSGQVAEGLNAAIGSDVSEKDIDNMITAGRNEGDFEEAGNSLKVLKSKQKAGKISKNETKRLQALESMEKLGILQDKEAYETFTESGTVSGVTAAAITAEKNKKNKQLADEQKAQISKNLGDDLKEKAAASSTTKEQAAQLNEVLKSYTDKDGKLDSAKLMKDVKEGTGVFDQATAEKRGIDLSKGAYAEIKDRVGQANEAAADVDKAAAGKEGEKDGTTDVAGQMKDLAKALNDSKLTKALESIATNLGK